MTNFQLFKTPNAMYAYDGFKCEIIQITKETFMYLRQLEKKIKLIENLKVPVEYVELKERGYFSEKSPVTCVNHPYSTVLNDLLARKLSTLTLQVTQQCNFRCDYCIYSENRNIHQRGHSNRSMSLSIAKKAVDFLWLHSVDTKEIRIGFYGGEPLLAYDLIYQIVTYAKEKFFGKNLSFNMTTNGSLLSKKIINFLVDNDFHLLISLDGPKEIHDANRQFADGKGTYDIILKNVAFIKKVYPKYWKKIQYSMVINPVNDFDKISQISNVNEFLNDNILPSIVDLEYDDKEVYASEQYKAKLEYQRFLAYLEYWNRCSNTIVSSLALRDVEQVIAYFENIERLGPLLHKDAPSGPCIPGIFRTFVDVDGNIYPCERVSEQTKNMCIGNIVDGFQSKKVKELLEIGKMTEQQCSSCWSFRLCNQCAKKADKTKGGGYPQRLVWHNVKILNWKRIIK